MQSDTAATGDVAAGGPPHLFSDGRAREIVVTPQFLQLNDYPEEPEVVWLDYRNQRIALTVVGVTAELPGHSLFLVPNDFAHEVRGERLVPDPLATHCLILPFPAGRVPQAAEAVGDWLEQRNLEVESGAEGGLILRVTRGRQMPGSMLQRLAESAGRRLVEQGLLPQEGWQIRVPPPEQAPEEQARDGYTTMYGSAYVGNVSDRPEVADLLEARGLHVDRQAMDAFEQHRRMIGQLTGVLSAFAVIGAVVILLNLTTSIMHRVREHQQEIGILKACGLSQRGLVSLYGLQCLILSTTAWLCSMAGAWKLGHWLAGLVSRETELFRLGVRYPLLIGGITIGACVTVAVMTSLWFARRETVAVLRAP